MKRKSPSTLDLLQQFGIHHHPLFGFDRPQKISGGRNPQQVFPHMLLTNEPYGHYATVAVG
jgi:hypothetical protein